MQIKTKNVSCHTADTKPVKQEVNGTVILPPVVFPGLSVVLMAKPVVVAELGWGTSGPGTGCQRPDLESTGQD